jgi:Carboxymuconolactone decarboxylase family
MAEFPKSFRQFTGEHAAVATTYKALGEACAKAGPLDERTRELVKVGMAVAGRLEGAVHSHARRAPDPRGRRQAAIDQGETIPAQAEGSEIARNLTRPHATNGPLNAHAGSRIGP